MNKFTWLLAAGILIVAVIVVAILISKNKNNSQGIIEPVKLDIPQNPIYVPEADESQKTCLDLGWQEGTLIKYNMIVTSSDGTTSYPSLSTVPLEVGKVNLKINNSDSITQGVKPQGGIKANWSNCIRKLRFNGDIKGKITIFRSYKTKDMNTWTDWKLIADNIDPTHIFVDAIPKD